MVEPCSTSSSVGMRQPARLRLSATPRVGSAGTVEVFDVTMRPSTQPTKSVKVPPISTPTTFIPIPTTLFLPAREAAFDQADQLVEGNCHESQRQDKRHQGSMIERFRIGQ